MSKIKLKFPTYEFLKSLPRTHRVTHVTRQGGIYEHDEHLEYSITLFSTPVSVYGRFTLNEDDTGMIFFDVMEDGYCDHNNFGRRMKFNKKNYAAICKYAQSVYDMFINELEQDLSDQWEGKSVEQFVELFGG